MSVKLTTKQKKLLEVFRQASKPTVKADIVPWAKDNVRLPYSAISPVADLTNTPWLIEPARAVTSGKYTQVCVRSPIGSGKSTLIEILSCYAIAVDSGSVLTVSQSDGDASTWMETRLIPCLNASPSTSTIMGTLGRYACKKELIKFPHMEYHSNGANLNSLQSKSVRYVFGDEVWRWDRGLVREAKGRLHDRWNGVLLFVSQGGVTNDDFDKACAEGELLEYHWGCVNKECNALNKWSWEDIKYTKTTDDNGAIQWKETLNSVHMCCPDCGHVYKDTAANRRKLASGSTYLGAANNYIQGKVTYAYPATAIFKISWASLVEEWLKAQDEKRRGNLEPLAQFLQKRLGQSWNEEEAYEVTTSALDVVKANYTFADTKTKSDKVLKRIATVDVQGGDNNRHFYVVVRDWYKGGKSRLVYAAKIEGWENLTKLVPGYSIDRVFIDMAYEQDEVLEWCVVNQAVGVFGTEAKNGYQHKRGKKYHSTQKPIQAKGGKAVTHTYHTSYYLDIWQRLKTGQGTPWELPSNIFAEYESHQGRYSKKEVKGQWVWVKHGKRRDYADCEVMQIVAAQIYGIY